VGKGLVKTFPVDTKDQITNALTKPLSQNDFQRHRRFMCGK
jgi:replication initiation and membrane attachment protein DnaB